MNLPEEIIIVQWKIEILILTQKDITFHGHLNDVMRTVWSAFILLVSMLQGNVYLMCMYLLIILSNAGEKGCWLKLKSSSNY